MDRTSSGSSSRTCGTTSAMARAASATVTNHLSADSRSSVNFDPITRYTLGEEIANSLTSGIASGRSGAALVVMVVHAARRGDGWCVAACAIFGASLILSNLSSTLYHAIAPPPSKRVFRVLDHLSIYFLIAGTYMPFVLVSLRGAWGWTLCGIVLGAGRAGPRHQADDATSSARAVHRVLSRHGLDGAHRDQACPGARATRGCLAAAGRRTLLHGRGDILRLETAAVRPRDLAPVRPG